MPTSRDFDLDARRRSLGISVEALSGLCGVSTATIRRILSGKHRQATFGNVERVAQALGVDLTMNIVEDADIFRERQARAKAERIIALVQGTSALEGLAVGAEDRERMVEATVRDLLGSNRRLWAK